MLWKMAIKWMNFLNRFLVDVNGKLNLTKIFKKWFKNTISGGDGFLQFLSYGPRQCSEMPPLTHMQSDAI